MDVRGQQTWEASRTDLDLSFGRMAHTAFRGTPDIPFNEAIRGQVYIRLTYSPPYYHDTENQ